MNLFFEHHFIFQRIVKIKLVNIGKPRSATPRGAKSQDMAETKHTWKATSECYWEKPRLGYIYINIYIYCFQASYPAVVNIVKYCEVIIFRWNVSVEFPGVLPPQDSRQLGRGDYETFPRIAVPIPGLCACHP